jgi:multidrug resistance efflux pump
VELSPALLPNKTEIAVLLHAIKASREYREGLKQLLAIYEKNVRKAEEKLEQSERLFAEGLMARSQVEESSNALANERAKVEEVRRNPKNGQTRGPMGLQPLHSSTWMVVHLSPGG